MKFNFFIVILSVFAACSKTGLYHCQCTITTTVGSGTYVGSNSARARAEADCSDKIAEVTAGGQTANCDVVEDKD